MFSSCNIRQQTDTPEGGYRPNVGRQTVQNSCCDGVLQSLVQKSSVLWCAYLFVYVPAWVSCLSLCEHISRTTRPDLYQTLMHVACNCGWGCGLLLFWRRCNALCTSGFVDDVVFFYNWPFGPRQYRCSDAAAASCAGARDYMSLSCKGCQGWSLQCIIAVFVCLCVCLSVWLSVGPWTYIRNYMFNLLQIFVLIICGLVFFLWRGDTLCTSGFMDDVIFCT